MTSEIFIAYGMALAFSLGFLLIAAIGSYLIPFEQGSNPKDKQKRKICFWTLGALVPVFIFLIGFFLILSGIRVPSKQAAFTTNLGIATCIGLVLYIFLGFILSRIFRHGKIGHWF